MIKTEINKILKKAVIDTICKYNKKNKYYRKSPGFQSLKNYIKSETVNYQEKENFGHFSTNIALALKHHHWDGSSNKLAKDIAEQLNNKKFFTKIEVASPGFINFWIKPEAIQKEFVEIYKKGNKWGSPLLKPLKDKKNVVIDYCGVNIAKPMSVGHLRSTIIGQAIYNVFKFSGYKVIGDNHLGDWGKQFGVLLSAYKEEMAFEKLGVNKKNLAIDDLMKLYVYYTARMSKDAELEQKAKNETKKLQEGNKENIKIWKEFHKITFHELKKIFKMLNVKIDNHLGESFYNNMLFEIVEDAISKKIAVKSEGAIVIFTDENKPPFIIQKSDGAYLYTTTDIATIKYRIKKFKPSIILYVVGNEQSLHLDQLFNVSKKLGYIKNEQLTHIKFGLVLSEDMKKLSTRAGKHISLEYLLNEAIVRAKKVINEKQPTLSEKKKNQIAKVVGIGAVKYNDLSQNRQSDIAFNWDKMLNFEGNSAPYLLYTYARLKSILRKSKPIKFDAKYLTSDIELKLVRDLEEFPFILERVKKDFYPNHIADYLYNLAGSANIFYHTSPVLKAKKGEREARLALIKVISETLKTGLNLLGIETIEQM
ncbi:arginine--tRNA ligase [Candidatus Wolfebacteria bacterium CG10_big_fil_rev_8_21_14_0_10_31_9]|uniref:Arginine--tRNA ligase n=1 Tax=Candidatus Wolfebacteria bacterium CG10_big_fil_rev_8_21_14_0_10_31_9 TaxID=1975070 RepID=A0A2H0RC36_9BACT|nr:MAG: arginine--tRNA ligase [Candidatus Wolfebacteria bacterium CG10_big_fil_rev_8_21_14_0_10_31_9]